VMELGSEEAIMWTRFKAEFYWEYSLNLRRSTPRELHSERNRVVRTIGVVDCILEMWIREDLCYECSKTLHSELQLGKNEWY
jgi:hypothetical protein